MDAPRAATVPTLARDLRVMALGALAMFGFYLLLSLPDGGPGLLEAVLVALLVAVPIAIVVPTSRLPRGAFLTVLAVTTLGALVPVALPYDAWGSGPIDAATLAGRPALVAYLVVLLVFCGVALEGLRRLIRWDQARRDAA
ncbi:hypothetical protein [Roseomonas fluvialis]|nr:hypothetical protein [Roseomonas fluvialis]